MFRFALGLALLFPLIGCSGTQLREEERQPVRLDIGLMPLLSSGAPVEPKDTDTLIARLQAMSIFDSVRSVDSSHSPDVDLVLALEAHLASVSLRIYGAASQEQLYVGKLRMDWNADYGINAVYVAREIIGKFGPGTPEFKKLIAARATRPARQAPGLETPHLFQSDIDRPGYRMAEHPDDFALVVGVEKYSDLPEARFAGRDAEAAKDHLLALGFPSRNIVQLSDDKAGYKSIEKYLETWLPRNSNENSRVFFYFSGHGAPDVRTGQAYLLPWDGDPGFLETTGYPVKRLYEKLSTLKAKEVIVALDACFSGAGGRSVLAKGARPLVMKVDTATAPQNLTVFAAASGEQITSTLEDQGHGTFTYYFLKGLSGGAKDASGRVTTQALYDYLKPKVQDAARRQNRDQEPVLHGQGDRELVRF